MVSHCSSDKRGMMVQHLKQTCVIDTEGVSWIRLRGIPQLYICMVFLGLDAWDVEDDGCSFCLPALIVLKHFQWLFVCWWEILCFCWSIVTRWFGLCLLSLFSVGASNLECKGCEGSLFIFSLWRGSFSSLLSSNDSRPTVLSTSEIGVVFIPPVIILSPEF